MAENHLIRVLLIEDNNEFANLLKRVLSGAPHTTFEVVHIMRLPDALREMQNKAFDVILLSLSLVNIPVLEAVQKVRAQAPLIPLIGLAEVENQDVAIQVLQHGIQDYLVKGHVDGKMLEQAIHY